MTPNAPPLADTTRSRYPGTHPFTDRPEDHARFFGREDEVEQLYLRVLSVPLLVQFGRSGLGKTSLLQAGLFPRLREKPFLPVMVRLNVAAESLTGAVLRSMQESCESEGLEFSPGETTGLWELLLTTSIWRSGYLLTPVLVFDQFEEVFTLRDAAFRAELAPELGALATGKPPARIERTAGRAAPQVKLVISLREDYLGELEEFSAAIPGLFHERLRLEPMSQESARKAVVCPARLERAPDGLPYSSPRFEPDEAVLAEMIGSGVIEPFQLQLLCGHAEAVAKAKGGPEPVALTANDFRGAQQFALVLKNFYRDTLHRLSPPSQRRRAAELCEEGLLDGAGHRLMLHEAQILADYGVEREPLNALCNARLIRSERRHDRTFYEISHDRLADSILEARKNRIPKRVRRLAAAAGVVTLIVIGLSVAWQVRVDRERKETERHLAFLLGNSFLGEIRDTGRSSMMIGVRDQVRQIETNENAPEELRALALRHAGDVEQLLSNLPLALERHREAAALFAKLGDERAAAETHMRVADMLYFQARFPETLKSYETAIERRRRITAKPDATADDCVDLADAIIQAAWLHNHAGRTDAAASATSEAVTIVTNVLFGGSGPCAGKWRELTPYPPAGALNVLSVAARVRTLLPDSYEDARATASLAAQASAMRPYSFAARKTAIVAVGDRGHQQPTPQQRVDDYAAAVEAFEELWRLDPSNPLSRRERAVTQLMLVEGLLACHYAGDCPGARPLSEAESMVLDSLALLRNLAVSDPTNAVFHGDISWALLTHGLVLSADGRQAEALARVEAAERHDARRPAGSGMLVENLVNQIQVRAIVLARLARPAQADRQIRRAVAIIERELAAHPDNPSYLARYAAIRDDEAFILNMRGDEAGAARAEEQAEVLRRQRQTMSDDWTRKLDENTRLDEEHYKAGLKALEENDAERARDEFTASAELARAYVVLRPTAFQSFESLAMTYWSLATAHLRLGNTEPELQALTAAMHAAQIGVWLAEKGESASITQRLLRIRKELATRLYFLGNREAASAILQEHIVVADQSVRANPNPDFTGILGHAKCLAGIIRHESNEAGWEESIRSGLIHLENAGQRDPVPGRFADIGSWRVALADALDRVKRPADAKVERVRALEAYRKELERNPNDAEAKKAVATLQTATAGPD